MKQRESLLQLCGVVSTPVLSDKKDGVREWLEEFNDGNDEPFVPAVAGRAAIELLDRPPALRFYADNSPSIDLDAGIWMTSIQRWLATVPYDGGYVAILVADFKYFDLDRPRPGSTEVEAEPEAEDGAPD